MKWRKSDALHEALFCAQILVESPLCACRRFPCVIPGWELTDARNTMTQKSEHILKFPQPIYNNDSLIVSDDFTKPVFSAAKIPISDNILFAICLFSIVWQKVLSIIEIN